MHIPLRHLFRPTLVCAAMQAVCFLRSPAQEEPSRKPQEPDTGKPAYALPEVVVTATRRRTFLTSVPSTASVVDAPAIAVKPGALLADALSGLPATYFRAYGGPEAIRSLSLRGMGAENTLVMVDGHPVNDQQNGQVDFGLPPSGSVERIEVVKGGYSALYGADAAGGVVNVFTRRPPEGLSLDVAGSAGSAGFTALQGIVGGRLGDFGCRAFIRNEVSAGDYSFRFDDGLETVTLKRQNADSRALSGDALLEYESGEDIRIALTGSFLDAERGSPGPVTRADESGEARLEDDAIRSQLSLDWRWSGTTSLWIAGSYRRLSQDYRDPAVLINGSALESHSTGTTLRLTPEFRFSLSPALSGAAGAVYTVATVTGTDVGDARRQEGAIYANTQHILPLPWKTPFELAIVPSLRWDGSSDFGSALSARVGINMGILGSPELRFRASAGQNYRAPTLNDMYWQPGGNPDLRHETSTSVDCGMIASVTGAGEWKASIDGFSIVTRDRIVWTPVSGTYWSPVNAGEVASTGIETELTWLDPSRVIRVSLNSTWNRVVKRSEDYPGDIAAGKRLVYLPAQTANASVTLTLGSFQCFGEYQWVSYRFTTESNESFLPHYSLLSASVLYAVAGEGLSPYLKLEGTNLLNSDYQIIALYPMPLRQVRATVGVRL